MVTGMIGYARIDYLTARFDSLESALIALGPDVELGASRRSAMHGYDSAHPGPFGLLIFTSAEVDRVLVRLPGQFCEAAAGIVWRVMEAASTVTRLDICADFEAGRFVDKLREAVLEGRVTTIKSYQAITSNQGRTVYLGSRQSSIFVRAYDRRGVDRLEVEVKEDAADTLARFLLSGGSVGAALVGLLAKIRPVKRSGSNRSYLPALSWWAEMMAELGTVPDRLRAALAVRVPKSIDRRIDWLRSQVGPTLATLFDLRGADLLADLLGSRRKLDLIKLDRSETALALG